MRLFLLAMLALALAVPPAEAARRDERRGEVASRSAQQAPKPATTRPSQVRQPQTRQPNARPSQARQAPVARSTAARSAPARGAATRGQARQPVARATLERGDVRTESRGLLIRSASAATIRREPATSCTRRNGRTVCGPARSSVAGWQAGLPVADQGQRECPDGTFATLARGHENVVRCMPM
jgi:hypothetical protein